MFYELLFYYRKKIPACQGGIFGWRYNKWDWKYLEEGSFFALFCVILRKGGCPMITYSDLIQIGILVVGVIGLFIQANKKK